MRAGHLGHFEIGEYGYRAGIELVQGETTDSIATIISAGAECTVEQLLDLDQHLLFCCPPANWQRTDWETLRQLGQRRRVMIGFLDRWKSRNQSVQAKVKHLGEPGLARIHRWEPAGQETCRTQLSRDIDLICWLFGERPELVYASRPSDQEKIVQVHLGFSSGAMGLVDHCESLPDGADYYSLSIIGSQGAAYADDHRNQQLLFQGGPASTRHTCADIPGAARAFQEFVAAIEEERDPTPTIDDWLTASQIVEAALRSLSGQVEAVSA